MSTNAQNPYIGPRTFRRDEGHLFFGRDRESADLEALADSEKLVLFYAQSGAGKSSFVQPERRSVCAERISHRCLETRPLASVTSK